MKTNNISPTRLITVFLLISVCGTWTTPNTALGMLYKAPRGTMKDNCVVWHDGTFYLMTMYRENLSGNDLNFKHMWLATSKDGVHWEDRGPVIHNAPFPIWAMRAWKVGDRFIMNHGSWTPSGQTLLRFWESKDLVEWKYLGKEYDVFRPDKKRIDHMDVFAIDSDKGKQWYGYAAGGLLRSEDGVKWKWKEDFRLSNQNWGVGETGGCRRIGGKTYLLGGNWQDPRLPGKARGLPGDANYNVLTFVADHPEGPFRPDYPALRLNGNSGSRAVAVWASFCDTPGEMLLVNYIADPHAPILWWHAPLKKAVIDKEGHLRTGYWKGNDALKGKPIPIRRDKCTQVFPKPEGAPGGAKALAVEGDVVRLVRQSGKNIRWFGYDVPQTAVAMLGERFDPDKGFVLEGRMRVDKLGFGRTGVGLYFEEQAKDGKAKPQKGMAALLHTHRCTEIGPMHLDQGARFECDDRTGFGCATVAGIDASATCTFRLLLRKNIFELYLNDMLVQTYYVDRATGRVGLVVRDGQATFDKLQAWEMSLD